MTTTTAYKPTDEDFDRMEAAVSEMKPSNSKQIIVDYLRTHGIPQAAPDPALFSADGVVIRDTFENYLQNSGFYSTGSFAKLANGTPLDFQYDTTDGLKAEIEKCKDKSHFDLGTFVHEAILEPERWEAVVCEPQASRASHEGLDRLIQFWSQYVPVPEMPATKVDEKKAIIAHMAEASGMRSIDMQKAMIVQRIHERWSNYENGLWYGVLNAANREVSMYCNDFQGLPVRIRPDGVLYADQIGVNAIVSVKTTAATSIKQYARDFVKFGYDIKEAAYQRIASKIKGLDFSATIMIVLSTVEPFHVGVFILDQDELRMAYHRFSVAMETAKLCLSMGKFHGWDVKADVDAMGLIDLSVYGN